MSVSITVTTYLFSMWNVNVLVLFAVVLAMVILPGTGLKRKVRGWFSKSSDRTTISEANSLSSTSRLKTNKKIRAKYGKV